MHILLIILLVVVGLIALVLIVALFSKKGYTILRGTTIGRSRQEVYHYLKVLDNQRYFSKWVMMDPDLKITTRGTDGSIGAVQAWEGNKQAGKGEQEIVGLRDGERIDVVVRFEQPFAGVAQVYYATNAASAGQTTVQWGMTSVMNWPANAMLLFMNMDKMLGKDMEISLANLKAILEK